jgi:transposase InsO family protein
MSPGDRVRMVVLASLVRRWREALLLVQPETLLRWHRQGFRLFWRYKAKSADRRRRRIEEDTITLIRRIARENLLWGAERIRGELLKLGIRVCKRTIQKYAFVERGPRSNGQSWSTFLDNHGRQIWACDFLQTYDAFFRSVFAFFIVELGTRKIVHVGVTRSPTRQWTAQQLRNDTQTTSLPRFLIRDNDSKFSDEFDEAAKGVAIDVIRTPYHAPKANAVCERFLGSVRRECLDHVLILNTRQLEHLLSEYVAYYNESRPHQGIAQQVPFGNCQASRSGNSVDGRPVLGGLHHDYRWAA